jgi:hypothetical protein
MSRFEDVEQFVREHRGCGTLTPIASSPGRGGYLLILSCSCGQQFQRWVTAEEAEFGPMDLATAASAGPATPSQRPEPTAIDLSAASASADSLEDVMKAALEAVEAPRGGAPSRRRIEIPPAEPEPPEPVAPPPAAPPKTAAASPPGRPQPAGRAARRVAAPDTPDRSSLEDALRATLSALGNEELPAVTSTMATEGPAPGVVDLDAGASAKTAARPAPAAPETKPDKLALQDALRATLSAIEAERSAPAPRRRRQPLSVTGAVVISLLLAGAVAGGYALRAVGQQAVTIEPAMVRPQPRMRVTDNERASVTQAVSVLRDLQTVSRADVPYRVYWSRVSFAKGDVEKALEGVRDVDLRNALGEVLTLHLYAATAWRAKTQNEKDTWETVGNDPAAEICPGMKRLLTVSEDAGSLSRAHWRGLTVAAGVPLLWDCTEERLAEVERGLASSRDR